MPSSICCSNPNCSAISSRWLNRGGWYAADPFVDWIGHKLDSGTFKGKSRNFSDMTMAAYHKQTGAELSLVASDTSGQRMLILNHRTAPDLPIVWATRMSMSIPLLWQEVVWRSEWGRYSADGEGTEDISGSVIVDGGVLSNFPISLFMSNREDIAGIMGKSTTNNVLGLLIDEALPVADMPPKPKHDGKFDISELRTVQRLGRLVDTALGGPRQHGDPCLQGSRRSPAGKRCGDHRI